MYNFLLVLNSLGVAFSSMLLVNLSSTVYDMYTSVDILPWLGGHILAFIPVVIFGFGLIVTVAYKDKLNSKK